MSGTLLAISSEALLPSVDWAPSNSTKEPISKPGLDEIGIRRQVFANDVKDQRAQPFHEWDQETQLFLGFVLSQNGISARSLEKINSGLPSATGAKTLEIGQLGSLDYATIHYLSRLLLQVREAAATKSMLVICDDDKEVLSEIGKLVVSRRTPTPFDLPELANVTMLDGLDFAGGF